MNDDRDHLKIEDILTDICKSLRDIDARLSVLESKSSDIEAKTSEMHQHVHFVEWLQTVSETVFSRVSWISGYVKPPALITSSKNNPSPSQDDQ
jgi:hypothetical protein